MEGSCDEDLLSIQPTTEEYCWCCLRGSSETNSLYRCTKCGLHCHLTCSDPVVHQSLSEEEAKQFVCFTCQKCTGCESELCVYGRWEHLQIGEEMVTCCEECYENYKEDLYCTVCMKTMSMKERDKDCLKCSDCGKWVHILCDESLKKNKMTNNEEEKKHRGRTREDSIFDGDSTSKADECEEPSKGIETEAYRCPCCCRHDMAIALKQLKELDSQGIFLHMVTEEIAPNYYSIISEEKVMCFDTMQTRLEAKKYHTSQQFRDDFELMCYNAFKYNMMGDKIWEHTEALYQKGEEVLNEVLKGSEAGEYAEQIERIKVEKAKSSIQPEASMDAKQASLEAAEKSRLIEKMKVNHSKLGPLSPLPPPYSVLGFSMVTERILPQYSTTIAMDDCLVCGSTGDRDSMVFCVDCGECYHVYCTSTNGTVTPEMRRGWRCCNCKICEVCGVPLNVSSSDASEICTCNRCERDFHKSCLKYVDENNLNLFVCGYCFSCKKCGVKGTPTTWSYHKDYCCSCYNKEERFRRCAICQQPWSISGHSQVDNI